MTSQGSTRNHLVGGNLSETSSMTSSSVITSNPQPQDVLSGRGDAEGLDNCEDFSSTYYVRVSRTDGAGDCTSYSMAASNGL